MIRRASISLFLLSGLFLSEKASGYNNQNQILEQASCSGCHGVTALNRPASEGFAVIDPDTNTAVTAYSPGKVYRVEIKFTNPAAAGPWRNAYRLVISETSTGVNLRAGSIINSGTIGVVTDEGPTVPQRNARIITSSNRQTADNLSLEWQAPNDGRVRFRLFRMEANNNNTTGGDRVSQAEESLTLLSAVQNDPNMEDVPEPEEEIIDSTTTENSNRYDFGDLTAACGSLRSSSEKGNIIALLMAFALFVFVLRGFTSPRHRTSKSNSKQDELNATIKENADATPRGG